MIGDDGVKGRAVRFFWGQILTDKNSSRPRPRGIPPTHLDNLATNFLVCMSPQWSRAVQNPLI